LGLSPTPSQTVGPFFSLSLRDDIGPELVPPDMPGQVVVTGTVVDGAGDPVPDAMIEIWQADAEGRYAHPDDPRFAGATEFTGFGRCATDERGNFTFRTIKPGAVPGRDGRPQAPHLVVGVFARGLLKRLVTRMYFPDEPLNESDRVLASVQSERQRAGLVARRTGNSLRFDIHLQGDDETAFFDV
jgi:protocatechuate 3,4-dioxygenase alpha subunit